MGCDQRLRFIIERRDVRALEHDGVVKRELSFLFSQQSRCAIGFALDDPEPPASQRYRVAAAVGRAKEQQCVGESGDAEADAALGLRFLFLLRERVGRNVDDIIQHPHCSLSQRP